MRSWVASLLCLLAPALWAASFPEVYHTAAQPESAPKYIGNPDGRIGGICVDLFRLMEQREPALRIQGDQAFLPLRRLEKSVLHGQLDFICGVGDNPARRHQFIYLQPPVFTVRYHLAVRSDDTVEVKGWDDVRALGKEGTILINHGSGAIERLQTIGGLIIDSGGISSSANYHKLLMKRGRFVYYRSPGFEFDIRQHNLASQIRILPTVMEETPFYILFYQQTSHERLGLFANTLQQVAKSGELASLVEHYR
ncbi:transporter substrate-binding domain-containing protein [Aeromonas salmonicida]|uniref:substrate-binding periplasmic protein n=1 Tax=Aeromonas salmonicida TaxID=645 RepID=UPI00224022CB|nr:transporter substrate-binding domain-containing protein [Aeromonas salmonicida]MDF8330621.1 transporter substrate-binding domain-containing protein [Aeromonas salmonicida]